MCIEDRWIGEMMGGADRGMICSDWRAEGII